MPEVRVCPVLLADPVMLRLERDDPALVRRRVHDDLGHAVGEGDAVLLVAVARDADEPAAALELSALVGDRGGDLEREK